MPLGLPPHVYPHLLILLPSPWSQGEGEKTRWVHANSLGFRVWRATSVGKDKAIARRLSVCFTRRLIPMCLVGTFHVPSTRNPGKARRRTARRSVPAPFVGCVYNGCPISSQVLGKEVNTRLPDLVTRTSSSIRTPAIPGR